jgi:hypothetical protein
MQRPGFASAVSSSATEAPSQSCSGFLVLTMLRLWVLLSVFPALFPAAFCGLRPCVLLGVPTAIGMQDLAGHV